MIEWPGRPEYPAFAWKLELESTVKKYNISYYYYYRLTDLDFDFTY